MTLLASAWYFASFVERQRVGLERLQAEHAGFVVLSEVDDAFTDYQAAVLFKDSSPERMAQAWTLLQQRLDAFAAVSPQQAHSTRAQAQEYAGLAPALREAIRIDDTRRIDAHTQALRRIALQVLTGLRSGFEELDGRYKARLDAEMAAQQRWQGAFRTAMALATLGLLAYAAILVRTIVGPLGATVAGIRALRRGQPVPELPRGGEFGQISEVLDELRDATQRLRDLAYYDPLTGLSSRARFEQVLGEAMAEARRGGRPPTVVLVELHGLQDVAVAYGPSLVERCLRSAGERALFAVPAAYAPSRYGESRLAWCATGSPEAVRAETHGILEALRAPLSVEGLMLHLQAQAGIARFPADGVEVPFLLAAAETALNTVRGRRSGDIAAFDPSIAENYRRDFQLLQDLERGLANDELGPFFQPIVDCQRGEVIEAEALVRWQHPQRGLLDPMEFLPLAERTGQVAMIDARMADCAIAELARWRVRGQRLRLALNLSPRNLAGSTVTRLEGRLRQHRLAANELTVELTESDVIGQGDEADRVIHGLHALGAKVCLDDFGTGYSSLAYVHRLPIGQLKIDRSFVLEIGRSAAAERIIEATLSLARSVAIDVVGEGVETREQMLWLMRRGCVRQQGYLFARPMPAGAFGEWLEAAPAELQGLLGLRVVSAEKG